MSSPQPEITEELLSAYLDGELSAEEQQLVDEALQQDAALRDVLSELEEIRDQIRQLPQHTLHTDLSSNFAETFADRQNSNGHLADRAPNHTYGGPQSWFWGVLATAAVILIALWGMRPTVHTQSVALSSSSKNIEIDSISEGSNVEAMPSISAESREYQVMEDLRVKKVEEAKVKLEPEQLVRSEAALPQRFMAESNALKEQAPVDPPKFDAVLACALPVQKISGLIDEPKNYYLGAADAQDAYASYSFNLQVGGEVRRQTQSSTRNLARQRSAKSANSSPVQMVVVEGDIDSLNSTLAALQVTPVQIAIENAAIESVLNVSNSTSLQNMSAPSSPLSEQRKGTQPDASLPNGVDKFAAGDSIESDAVQRMELNRSAVPSAAELSAITQLRKTKNSVSPTSAAMQPSQPTNYKILLLITPTETGERQ